jgi:hypothetical protein
MVALLAVNSEALASPPAPLVSGVVSSEGYGSESPTAIEVSSRTHSRFVEWEEERLAGKPVENSTTHHSPLTTHSAPKEAAQWGT